MAPHLCSSLLLRHGFTAASARRRRRKAPCRGVRRKCRSWMMRTFPPTSSSIPAVGALPAPIGVLRVYWIRWRQKHLGSGLGTRPRAVAAGDRRSDGGGDCGQCTFHISPSIGSRLFSAIQIFTQNPLIWIATIIRDPNIYKFVLAPLFSDGQSAMPPSQSVAGDVDLTQLRLPLFPVFLRPTPPSRTA